MIPIPFFADSRWTTRDLWDWLRDQDEPDGGHEHGWRTMGLPTTDLRAQPKRGRSKARGTRPWSQVGGICLHQTAVGPGHMGRRSIRGVPAHAVVGVDAVYLLWDPTVVLWHGHAANRWTIGIEIDCRAARIEGDDRTVWLSRRDKAARRTASDVLREATNAQLDAAASLCRYYDGLRDSHDSGGPTAVIAHRQSHRSRVGDPGSRIWQGVKARLADEPDIEFPEDETWGSGKPIPEEWRG